MTFHLVCCLWLLAVALTQHLVLQSAGQGDNALFLAILRQEVLACHLRRLAFLLGRRSLLGLLLCEELLHEFLSLVITHLQ